MIQYIEAIISVFIISLVILLEWLWRKNDRKKIYAYIDRIGGEVYYISKIAYREHIYSVEYHVGDEKRAKTVKFTMLQDAIWF